ncbi:MAG: PASTA domain-containing protein [Treponema sp.]|nr:PASTA domain-containing protein [Treponema sp.]
MFFVFGFWAVAAIAALVILFVVPLRGEERVMVPNVEGMTLAEAVMALQARDLNSRVQMRHSQSPQDMGSIIEQDPPAGAMVREGRGVQLVVSLGVVIDRMDNFVGRNIDNVRMDLQAFAAVSSGALFTIAEPVMLDYSPEPPGTIIQQRPEPGFGITGPTRVEFVVSLGPRQATISMPQLTGLSISEALQWLGEAGIAFEFFTRHLWDGEDGETVVQQTPAAGSIVTLDSRLVLTASAPEALSEGEVFGLFSHTLAPNPFPLPVRLEALLPSGQVRPLFSGDSSGGLITIPYRLPSESTLILSMMDRIVHRETVR